MAFISPYEIPTEILYASKIFTADADLSLFHNVVTTVEKVSRELHDTTYRVCFQPISHHLDKIKEVWVKLNADMRDLPDYSYSPMEYITQVGICIF